MPLMPPVKTAALEPPVNLSRVKGQLTDTRLLSYGVRSREERKMKMKEKGKQQRNP
jgi:hypothetical protein